MNTRPILMAAIAATLAASCLTLLQENAFGQNASAITTPTQTNGTDPKIEYYLAKKDWDSLAKMGQPAVPRMVAALSDNDESVRQGAIDALGRIGDRSAIEPLVTVLKDYKSMCIEQMAVETRQHAVKALAKLGYTSESADDKVVLWFWGHKFMNMLATDESTDIKSLEDLVKPLPDAVSPLCGLLLKLKANKEYRSAPYAAYALGKIGSTNAVDTLIAVADGKDYVRSIYANVAPDHPLTKAAVTALGKIRDPKAIDPLIKLLDDPNAGLSHDVLEACAHALGELGDARAAAPLGKLLNQQYSSFEYGDTDYRPAVCDALVKFGTVSVEPLIKALSYKGTDASSAEIRRLTAEALGKIGDKRAVQPLCGLLNDKEFQVRRTVVVALGKLKDQQAINPLIGALKDSDSGVRADAAKALDELGWKP